MPTFAYQVRKDAGKMRPGALTASDLAEASRSLHRDGGVIVDLREDLSAADGADPAAALGAPIKKVKRKDVIFFATQLAIMVDTGVPLDEALDAIAEQSEHTGLKALVRDLSDQVKGGEDFSSALEGHPKIFDDLFVALMRASEASGTMGQMLMRVSEYMHTQRETRNRVKGAMIYPACMLSFCLVVVICLMIFILPRFEKIYAGKGAVLPVPTQILLGISAGLIAYWPFLLGGLIAVVVGAHFYLKTRGGRILLHRVLLNTPLIGPMCQKACLARSLRTMATMVSSGVGLLDGLAITAQAAGNHFYAVLWNELAQSIREGSGLAETLFGYKLIPRTITQMIDAGERTGRLAEVMDRVAGFVEEDLKVAIKTITSMIEPVMIIVMGLLVGGIALALLLPVFSISKVVAQH